MIGRYGVDSLSKFMLGTAVVLLVFAMGFRNNFLNTLACLLVLLCYFRMFSRNYQKRAEENQKFLELKGKATTFLKREKSTSSRGRHIIFTSVRLVSRKSGCRKEKVRFALPARSVTQNLSKKVNTLRCCDVWLYLYQSKRAFG